DGLAERGEAASASGLLPDRPPLTLLREALGFGNTEGMAALAKLCQPEELGDRGPAGPVLSVAGRGQ
ncbi:hypothetical protein C7E25_22595, partial [Stenotrophomonas maltophilia]